MPTTAFSVVSLFNVKASIFNLLLHKSTFVFKYFCIFGWSLNVISVVVKSILSYYILIEPQKQECHDFCREHTWCYSLSATKLTACRGVPTNLSACCRPPCHHWLWREWTSSFQFLQSGCARLLSEKPLRSWTVTTNVGSLFRTWFTFRTKSLIGAIIYSHHLYDVAHFVLVGSSVEAVSRMEHVIQIAHLLMKRMTCC